MKTEHHKGDDRGVITPNSLDLLYLFVFFKLFFCLFACKLPPRKTPLPFDPKVLNPGRHLASGVPKAPNKSNINFQFQSLL